MNGNYAAGFITTRHSRFGHLGWSFPIDHTGSYEFKDATITYDVATGDYAFGGSVTIDGVMYNL